VTTPAQQEESFLWGTFGPPAVLGATLAAAFQQWRKSPIEWEQRGLAFPLRFASEFGHSAATDTTKYVMARLLDEDPAFRRCACTGVFRRARYAAFSPLTAHKRDGRTVFSIGRVVGMTVGQAVASTWSPAPDGPEDVMAHVGVALASKVATNLLREFVLYRFAGSASSSSLSSSSSEVVTPPPVEQPAQRSSTETGPPVGPASYMASVGDIVGFEFLLNRFDFEFVDRPTFAVTTTSIRRNLSSTWVVDNDPFDVNQFLHPYQGSVYFGSARSTGLGFWKSSAMTFGGSLLWEIAGETTTPSRNDQIASGIAGSFLGEPLFRLASLVLESADDGRPGFWRQAAAAVISPPTAVNRLVYGDRFKAIFPSGDPPVSSQFQLGLMGAATSQGTSPSFERGEATAGFAVDYGMPNGSAYTHRQPFDYFTLEVASSSASRFESIFSRGLIFGKDYGGVRGSSHPVQGVWGLYGSYDYVAPQLFRVSSTALSVGSSFRRQVFGQSALQGTIMAGIGYGAVGSLTAGDDRAYHYGVTPQVLANMRFLAGRSLVDLTLRDYHVSSIAAREDRGADNVARVDLQFTFRVVGHHAATVKYLWSQREAFSPNLTDTLQSRGSIGFFYTFLGTSQE
jgi:hypothetical protein